MAEQTTKPTLEGEAIQTWSGWRRTVFYSIVTLLLAGVGVTFWKVNLFPILAWLPDDFLNSFYASQLDFDHITSGEFTPHTIHYLAIAATHWSFMIGLILQFKDPTSNVAPMWQVTGGIGIVTLTYPFIDASRVPPPIFAIIGLALVAGLLHPSNIFKRRAAPWNPTMAVLTIVAAIPTLMLIVNEVGLQASGVEADTHWQGLHYNFMGEYGMVLLLVLALGASSLPGWRYSVWTGAFLAALMGMGFIANPHMASSRGVAWGMAMVAFSVVWLFLGERRHRSIVVAER